MLSNEEILIVMRWQINFDTDQKVAAIDQTTGSEGMFSHLCLTAPFVPVTPYTRGSPVSRHNSIVACMNAGTGSP
jgi:hypothetical protein